MIFEKYTVLAFLTACWYSNSRSLKMLNEICRWSLCHLRSAFRQSRLKDLVWSFSHGEVLCFIVRFLSWRAVGAVLNAAENWVEDAGVRRE